MVGRAIGSHVSCGGVLCMEPRLIATDRARHALAPQAFCSGKVEMLNELFKSRRPDRAIGMMSDSGGRTGQPRAHMQLLAGNANPEVSARHAGVRHCCSREAALVSLCLPRRVRRECTSQRSAFPPSSTKLTEHIFLRHAFVRDGSLLPPLPSPHPSPPYLSLSASLPRSLTPLLSLLMAEPNHRPSPIAPFSACRGNRGSVGCPTHSSEDRTLR